MDIQIECAILCDLTYWGRNSGLFNLEQPGRIGLQYWQKPAFQSTQTTDVQ